MAAKHPIGGLDLIFWHQMSEFSRSLGREGMEGFGPVQSNCDPRVLVEVWTLGNFSTDEFGLIQGITGALKNTGYDPNYVEYDDEVADGQADEVVMLDQNGMELGTVVKVGTG